MRCDCVEALHAFGQRAGDRVGQGQVHVVSAQQDVLADGQPREDQVAPFILDGDQGEVGRSAADVADQDDVAGLHLLAPFFALAGKPGVKRSLRLFEQRDILEPGLGGRLDRQLAGTRVERRGDGQEDLLILEPLGGRLAGLSRVPGVAKMLEKRGRRVDGRDPRNIFRRRPGQDRRAPIDARMREPALGRADQPAGDLGAVVAGKRADGTRPAAFSRAARANPAGNSLAAGMYRNDGRSGRSETSFNATTWGMANRSTGAGCVARCGRSSRRKPSAEFVVPRSIPMT